MAKRKRLTPAENTALESDNTPAPEIKSMDTHPFGVQPVTTRRAPIAQVAGDASAQAALEEVAGELQAARATGRMVLELPLAAVDETYLVRDRLVAETDELSVLMDSLRARGQQTPIEVVDLGLKSGSRHYGLISGWRRLTALRRLQADGQGGTVQALLRRPETAADAYLAMVEENEIRVGLSYYERARIVARAAEQGVYPDQAAALKGLFGSVSRSKRSKIGSFLKIYGMLDDRLQFPSAISERLGLALVKALEVDPGQGERLRERMRKTVAGTGESEVASLERFLKALSGINKRKPPKLDTSSEAVTENYTEVSPGIRMQADGGKLTLTGIGVTDDLVSKLRDWLITL